MNEPTEPMQSDSHTKSAFTIDPNELGITKPEVDAPPAVTTVERPTTFDPKRGETETYGEYRARRVQMRDYLHQHVIHLNDANSKNRATRRTHTKLRMTKPLRKVRHRWMYGKHDLTFAMTKQIPLHYAVRVAELGLDYAKLTELGKEYTREHDTREHDTREHDTREHDTREHDANQLVEAPGDGLTTN